MKNDNISPMEIIHHLIDFILHIDHHMNTLIADYGTWSYAILFLIIFCETGLVFTPFLPGDSLLFVLGALSAEGPLKAHYLFFLLAAAAILGDTVNYWIGHLLAPKIFRKENIRFLNMEHLRKTEAFFQKYGGKAIILARFLPIVRTFAPFLAGMGSMKYSRFLAYNIIGGVLWIGLFIAAGYYFGNLEIVKKNFSLVVMAIIVISMIPPVVEYWKHRKS